MSKTRDNSLALEEQNQIVEAMQEDAVCVSITAGSVLGALLLAFNAVARQFDEDELSPQEWVEKELPNALLTRKRAWKYAMDTRNEKAYADEMRTIAKLFTVPAPDHVKYLERMTARFEAEQACRVKYGIQ
jgi:hypothetical protein